METEKEVLVVASKVKSYLKSKDVRCSADAITALSDKVRDLLDEAVVAALADKRKTVKDRDFLAE